MFRKTIAYGKLLLFGEYSYFYGYPVLGTSIPIHTEVIVKKKKLLDLNKKNIPDSTFILSKVLIQKIVPGININEFNSKYIFKIKSNIIQGVGYGSSSALISSLTKAFSNEITFDGLWAKANDVEKYFNSKTSRINTALALEKGIKAFNGNLNSKSFLDRLDPGDLVILTGAVPRNKTSKEIIQKISKDYWKNDVKKNIDDLGFIAQSSVKLLKERKMNYEKYLGDNALIEHDKLRRLGLSSDLMDEIINTGIDNGALGGKMSSGGVYYFI